MHITDLHVDWLYKPGTLADAEDLCRSGKGKAGMFGDYNCYPPLLLFEESLRLMS